MSGELDVLQVQPTLGLKTIPLGQVSDDIRLEWEDPIIVRFQRRHRSGRGGYLLAEHCQGPVWWTRPVPIRHGADVHALKSALGSLMRELLEKLTHAPVGRADRDLRDRGGAILIGYHGAGGIVSAGMMTIAQSVGVILSAKSSRLSSLKVCQNSEDTAKRPCIVSTSWCFSSARKIEPPPAIYTEMWIDADRSCC